MSILSWSDQIGSAPCSIPRRTSLRRLLAFGMALSRLGGDANGQVSMKKGIDFDGKYHDEERKDDEKEDEDGMCFGQKDTVKLVVREFLSFTWRIEGE